MAGGSLLFYRVSLCCLPPTLFQVSSIIPPSLPPSIPSLLLSLAGFNNWHTSCKYVCLILMVCTWFWTCVRLDVRSFFSLRFFKILKIFLVMILCCLKSYCYIFDLYLFVLGRERFLTAYICLKETLFFSFSYISKYCLCFYYKIMKKLYMRTIIGSSGSDCFNYLISTLSL